MFVDGGERGRIGVPNCALFAHRCDCVFAFRIGKPVFSGVHRFALQSRWPCVHLLSDWAGRPAILAREALTCAQMTQSAIAITRLTEERKSWRRDHPFVQRLSVLACLLGVLRPTGGRCRRLHEPPAVGMRHPGKRGRPVGRGHLQAHAHLQRLLPGQLSKVRLHPSNTAPEHFPQRLRVPVNSVARMEADNQHQAGTPPSSCLRFCSESRRSLTSRTRRVRPIRMPTISTARTAKSTRRRLGLSPPSSSPTPAPQTRPFSNKGR